MTSNFPFPWYRNARRNGIVLDTGVILIHALAHYQAGQYLNQVLTNIPPVAGTDLSRQLKILLGSLSSWQITPEVLAEFQALAERRGHLNSAQLGDLLLEYSRFPIKEIHIPYAQLVQTKSEANAWVFSYTDTSVVLAAKEQSTVVLTTDRALRRLGNRLGVQVLHIYEDYYLHL